MTNKKHWNPHAFRVALASRNLRMPGFREEVGKLAKKYGFRLPSISWFYMYLSDEGARGPRDANLVRGICAVLKVPQRQVYKKGRS